MFVQLDVCSASLIPSSVLGTHDPCGGRIPLAKDNVVKSVKPSPKCKALSHRLDTSRQHH